MHELPIVKEVLKAVLRVAEEEKATKILKVTLEIGDMHDLIDEWVIKYFVFASKGTPAEGARMEIRRLPVICRCKTCQELFTARFRQINTVKCPVCGSESFSFVSGDELRIDQVEFI